MNKLMEIRLWCQERYPTIQSEINIDILSKLLILSKGNMSLVKKQLIVLLDPVAIEMQNKLN